MEYMQKITLTRVYSNDKDKEGKPLMSKAGKPYTKLAIKCAEHGDAWLSGFQNAGNKDWKEGDVVEVIITSQVGKDGKTYLNFETPKAEELLARQIAELQVWKLQVTNALMKAGILGAATAETVATAPKSSPAQQTEPAF